MPHPEELAGRAEDRWGDVVRPVFGARAEAVARAAVRTELGGWLCESPVLEADVAPEVTMAALQYRMDEGAERALAALLTTWYGAGD